MDYFVYLWKKFLKSHFEFLIKVLLVWGILYHLTDFKTILSYFWLGVCVCAANTFIANLRKRKIENIMHVQQNWVIWAGFVLLLYHAGFTPAAVLVSAAILVSPFFGATIYESVVGLSLLITLIRQM